MRLFTATLDSVLDVNAAIFSFITLIKVSIPKPVFAEICIASGIDFVSLKSDLFMTKISLSESCGVFVFFCSVYNAQD